MKGEKRNENHFTGYIKVFRSIRKHWIWEDPVKLKWWLDLLLEVNHKDKKVQIGFELIECKRGESLNSLKTWADRWGVDKSTVRRFFNLLQKDSMIVTKSVQKTTHLTVCNYESYNDSKHDEETMKKRWRNDDETRRNPNNNDNNVNNGNNIGEANKNSLLSKQADCEKRRLEFGLSLKDYSEKYERKMLSAFYNYWSELNKSKTKMRFEREATWELSRRLDTWESNGTLWSKGKNQQEQQTTKVPTTKLN